MTDASQPTPTYQPIHLDATHISQCLLLSQETGWNQVASDWEIFLTHGTVLGIVAQNRLVATAAVLPYGSQFGWISMVLVTSDWRRRGLATQLLAACIRLLRDAGRAALLDAAPAGEPLYQQLGFLPLCSMERWEGPGGADRPTNRTIESTSTAAQLAFDQSAFGADRQFLLVNFLARPGTVSFRSPQGFAILRAGSKTAHIGPVVADPAHAPALLVEAIRAASGRVFVDLLEAGSALIPTLEAHGFRSTRRFTRMALGLTALPGHPENLLAAAGPEFG